MCTGACVYVCAWACVCAASPDFPTISSSHSNDSFTHRDVRRLYGFPCWAKELCAGLSCVSCIEYEYSSWKHQIPDFSHLYKAERFLILHCLSAWKYVPGVQLSCLLNNLEWRVDWGSHFSSAVSNTATRRFPSLPPFFLSPILLPFTPSMGAESCYFLFWS